MHSPAAVRGLALLFSLLALCPVRADGAPAPPPAHGVESRAFPSHHFQWAPHRAETLQVAVNFGLVQLALGGFNVSAELRYRRLWLAYQHGVHLTLNNLGSLGLSRLALSSDEREQGLHVYLPYSTGFGVGILLVDELWLGAEFTASRFEVRVPDSRTASYETYGIGAVLGYRLFLWRALHVNAYVRYWPTAGNHVTLHGATGPVRHQAHSFGVYPNLAIGYAFDL